MGDRVGGEIGDGGREMRAWEKSGERVRIIRWY